MDAPVVAEIREVLASFEAIVTDLHVWKVGKGKFACIIALNNAAKDLSPAHIRQALSIHEEIVHISVELNPPLSTYTDLLCDSRSIENVLRYWLSSFTIPLLRR